MFQKIIVPLDGSDLSERALPVALRISEAAGGEVSICSAIDPKDQATISAYWALGGDMGGGIAALPPEDLVKSEAQRKSETEQYLARIKRDNEALANADSTVLTGDPSEKVLEFAQDQGAGLIVMGTRGRSGILRGMFGSVTDRLLRTADIPVVVVPPDYQPSSLASRGTLNIVVPLDGSKRSESALIAALPMAQKTGSTVRALHFVQIESRSAGTPFNEIAPIKANIDDLTSLASGYLEDVRKRYEDSGVTIQPEVLVGYPASHIAEYVKGVPNAMVVMTSHGRSGIKRFLMGSVTDATLRNSTAPVMVVPAIEE